jgi:aminoglycoside phosphotransferase family enzyme/predicted kinase
LDDQSETIAFLSRSESYGLHEPVLRCETHAAMVFLAGTYAYKLKRAVLYPYLDYSTVERRREMCEAELAVNRRTAPEIYIRVQPILRRDGQMMFGKDNDAAHAVDWVVVMQRFDQSELLEPKLRAGQISNDLLRELAGTIAQFHATAERCPDFGGSAVIGRTISDATQIFRVYENRPFDPARIEEFGRTALVVHSQCAAGLDRRKATGFVRRCHGDMHLNNIFVRNGHPVLFDAIEFNDEFSNIDTFYDLAFLLMDFDRMGARSAANAVFNRYLELTGDYDGVSALPLFLSCRAAVRAHVAATAAERLPSDNVDRLRHDAVSLLSRAIRYLSPVRPVLLAVGGFSGTGKSQLARAVAPLIGRSPGAVVLRSDVVRKRIFGVDETVRLPPTAYTQPITAKVYAEMRNLAGVLLSAGHSVIADAVHGTAQERHDIEAVARQGNAGFASLWLEASDSVIEQRLGLRSGDASDADISVARQQSATLQRPPDWNILDVSQLTPGECVKAVTRLLHNTEIWSVHG